MHQCIKFILFWNDTLHVSDGLSIHHQEFKTVHTATGIYQTDTAACLLNGYETEPYLLARKQQYLFDKCLLLYVQSWTPDDGWKDRLKHVECHFKIIKIWYIGASSWFYYRNCSNNSFKLNLSQKLNPYTKMTTTAHTYTCILTASQ